MKFHASDFALKSGRPTYIGDSEIKPLGQAHVTRREEIVAALNLHHSSHHSRSWDMLASWVFIWVPHGLEVHLISCVTSEIRLLSMRKVAVF